MSAGHMLGVCHLEEGQGLAERENNMLPAESVARRICFPCYFKVIEVCFAVNAGMIPCQGSSGSAVCVRMSETGLQLIAYKVFL